MNTLKITLLIACPLVALIGCNGPVATTTTGQVAASGDVAPTTPPAATAVTANVATVTNNLNPHFDFQASRCKPTDPVAGTFNYVDKNAPVCSGGVKMKGTIKHVKRCVLSKHGYYEDSDCRSCPTLTNKSAKTCAPVFVINVNYTSMNPQAPGYGKAIVCVGQVQEAVLDNPVSMTVDSGPYNGYSNQGTIVNGDFKVKSCPCPNK